MRSILSAFICVSFACLLQAQPKKIIHQTFLVEDHERIEIQLYEDQYELVFWAGNTILTETNITLENGFKHLLAYHVDSLSRYEIVDETKETTLLLRSFDNKRAIIAIQYKGDELYPNELIKTRVYIPDVFIKEGEHVYVRKEKN